MSPLRQVGVAGLLAVSALAAPLVVTDVEWSVTTVTVEAGGPTSHPVAAPIHVEAQAAAPAPKPAAPAPVPAPVAPVDDVTSSKSTTESVKSDAGVKRGLLFDSLGLLNSFMSVPKGTFGWCANWVSSPHGTVPGGLPFYPQFKSQFSSVWQTEASAAIASGSQYLMHLNEPDIPSQDFMSPSDAVASWKSVMEPFADKAKLVSPATSNSEDADKGVNWLKQFLAGCTDCSIHACGFHWHSPANFDYFKQSIESAHEACPGKPLWINEFSADDTEENQAAFLKEALPWLDNQTYIEKYAYFQASNLLSGNALNSAGQVYVSA